MSRHSALVEKANTAIEAVFGDKSVPKSQTLESLEELLELIQEDIEALTADEDES